jgi:ribosomal protein S18 acetylase RimI-like enzyme
MSVRLVPLSASEYDEWLAVTVDAYAEEKMNAGNWTADEAAQRSREEFAGLLPQGLETPNHSLLAIEDSTSGEHVGIVWFQTDAERGRAFIYDFAVHPQFQRRGYGRQALVALDDVVRERGLAEIALHVFGSNTTARALYEQAGYVITNINMTKKLI